MSLPLLHAGPGSTGNLPITLGAVAWFDFSDATSRVITSSKFEDILDKANSNDFTQSTASKRPVLNAANIQMGGLDSASFVSADETDLRSTAAGLLALFQRTANRECTIIAVQKRPNISASVEYVFSAADGSSTTPYTGRANWTTASEKATWHNAAAGGDDGPANRQSDSVQVVALRVSLTAAEMHINGVRALDAFSAGDLDELLNGAGYANIDQMAIGALWRSVDSSWGDYDLGEMVFFDKALNDGELQDMFTYLVNKWRMTISEIADIPGLVNYWKADSGDLEQTSGGDPADGESDPVGVWPDQEGGKDFVQIVSASRPHLHYDTDLEAWMVQFDGVDDRMTAGAAADWNLLHDGSDFTVVALYRVREARDAREPIWNTNDCVTTKIGAGYLLDNRTGQPTRSIRCNASTGAGYAWQFAPVANYAKQFNKLQASIVRFRTAEGGSKTEARILIDGEEVYDVAEGTPSGSDATHPLTIGDFAGGSVPAKIDILEMAIFNRALDVAESRLIFEHYQGIYGLGVLGLVDGTGEASVGQDWDGENNGHAGLVILPSGQFVCTARRGVDRENSPADTVVYFGNSPHDWTDPQLIQDGIADAVDYRTEHGLRRFSDGRLIAPGSYNDEFAPPTVGTQHSYYLQSIDDGVTWTEHELASIDPFDSLSDVSNIVETFSGRWVLAFHGKNVSGAHSGFDDLVIFLSDDQGATWLAPNYISDGSDDSDRHQEPGLVQLDSGRILLVAHTHTSHEVFFAYSDDDGETWSPSNPGVATTKLFNGWAQKQMLVGNDGTLWYFARSEDEATPGPPICRYVAAGDDPTDPADWSEEFYVRSPAARGVCGLDTPAYEFTSGTSQITYGDLALHPDGSIWAAWGEVHNNAGSLFVTTIRDPQPLTLALMSGHVGFDPNVYVTTAGGNVSSWSEEQGASVDFTASGGSQPTHDNTVPRHLVLDGDSDSMQISSAISFGTGAFTILFVSDPSQFPATVLGQIAASSERIGHEDDTTFRIQSLGGLAVQQFATHAPLSGWGIHVITRSASGVVAHYLNGVKSTGLGVTDTNAWTLDQLGLAGSATARFGGKIGRLMTWERKLTYGELNRMGAKVALEYDVTWTPIFS